MIEILNLRNIESQGCVFFIRYTKCERFFLFKKKKQTEYIVHMFYNTLIRCVDIETSLDASKEDKTTIANFFWAKHWHNLFIQEKLASHEGNVVDITPKLNSTN